MFRVSPSSELSFEAKGILVADQCPQWVTEVETLENFCFNFEFSRGLWSLGCVGLGSGFWAHPLIQPSTSLDWFLDWVLAAPNELSYCEGYSCFVGFVASSEQNSFLWRTTLCYSNGRDDQANLSLSETFNGESGLWCGCGQCLYSLMEAVMYLNQDLPSPTKNIVLYNKMRKVVVECKSKISNKVMFTAHFGGVVVNEKGCLLVVSHAPPLRKEDIVEMNIRKVGMKLFGQQCVLPKTQKGV
ncbi:hypothetical protein RHGRI_010388 [Rhododendron griersonianum]|uniref:Uncharacterized protein n=1 Tax=Rhododendron griersonianum TaxID=479676 RepID=A0AAV6KIE8_9ERIC|nr:hypothetical protein RHGRI_010388 [Rhododendron griersonianum]